MTVEIQLYGPNRLSAITFRLQNLFTPAILDNDEDIDVAGASIIGHDVCWWRNDGGIRLFGQNFL